MLYIKNTIKAIAVSLLFTTILLPQTIYADDVLDTLNNITIVTEEYPPYNYTKNGKPTGLITEILQEILKELSVNPKINTYPWDRSYKIAQMEPNVLIYSISRTPDREPLFKWIVLDIPSHYYIYKLKKRNDIVINNLEDTKKYSIQAVKEDVAALYLEKNKYPKINYSKEYVSPKMLLSNRIDLVLYDDISLNYFLKSSVLTADDFEKLYPIKDLDVNSCFAFSLQTDDKVVARFQEAFNKLKLTPRYKEIVDKYTH